MTDRQPTRVLSIPADHLYVRHTLGAVTGAVVLDDPTIPWWPPLGLDPRWLREHRHRFDLVHVHFGFEQIPVEQLRAWCATTKELAVPVVVTVHDLRNPHLVDNASHEVRLEILLDRADAVITLTDGAADEIRRRYGRNAVVLEHSHVLPLDHPVAPTHARQVGVYYASGRANVLPPQSIVPVLATSCANLEATLHVSVHEHAGPDLLDGLRQLRQFHDFRLRIEPRWSDEALFDDVAALHAVVLPYRFGTHSGWIELCRDVGTRVVAPDCGHYADQWNEVESYAIGADELPVAESLRGALERALYRRPPRPADRRWRIDQRDATANAHRAIYAAMMTRDAIATGAR